MYSLREKTALQWNVDAACKDCCYSLLTDGHTAEYPQRGLPPRNPKRKTAKEMVNSLLKYIKDSPKNTHSAKPIPKNQLSLAKISPLLHPMQTSTITFPETATHPPIPYSDLAMPASHPSLTYSKTNPPRRPPWPRSRDGNPSYNPPRGWLRIGTCCGPKEKRAGKCLPQHAATSPPHCTAVPAPKRARPGSLDAPWLHGSADTIEGFWEWWERGGNDRRRRALMPWRAATDAQALLYSSTAAQRSPQRSSNAHMPGLRSSHEFNLLYCYILICSLYPVHWC